MPKPKKVKPNKVTVKQASFASNTIDENYDVPKSFSIYYRLHNAESLMRKELGGYVRLEPETSYASGTGQSSSLCLETSS